MEADRKAMPGDANILAAPHFQEKITYKVGSKVIFGHVCFMNIKWLCHDAISIAWMEQRSRSPHLGSYSMLV